MVAASRAASRGAGSRCPTRVYRRCSHSPAGPTFEASPGDLALACACAAGDERAWEHFISVQRPVLYRAADALDPSGAARELADSLYADLYGLRDGGGGHASLFRYFHGRSSLSTWLRAVLAQRHVDRLRSHAYVAACTTIIRFDSAPIRSSDAVGDARRYACATRRETDGKGSPSSRPITIRI